MHSFDPGKQPAQAQEPAKPGVGIPPRRKPKPEPQKLGPVQWLLLPFVLLAFWSALVFATSLMWYWGEEAVYLLDELLWPVDADARSICPE